MCKDHDKFTYLPFGKSIDGNQIFWLAIISSTEHDNCFHIVYVNDNSTTQSRKHGCHFLYLFFGEVITTNLHCLMKFPVEMHILDNSSKDPTDSNGNIIFVPESNLFKCLKLLRGQKLGIMHRRRQLWKLILLEFL